MNWSATTNKAANSTVATQIQDIEQGYKQTTATTKQRLSALVERVYKYKHDNIIHNNTHG